MHQPNKEPRPGGSGGQPIRTALQPDDVDVVITEKAALAARFINQTNRHVFLTGKAGTGKTTFLHGIAQQTHKRFVVLAPTGIAALNAKGVTIHSQFLLPFGSFIPARRLPPELPEYAAFHDRDSLTRRHGLNATRRDVLRAIDLLIIDEVSMLRADLLDAIDHRLRTVRRVYHLPFGGVQLLLIGDLFQLPPVVKQEEWEVLKQWYNAPYFFESLALKEAGYAHIELDHIFRQQDGEFIQVLNNLRNDTVTPEDVELLNGYYRSTISDKDAEGVVTLTTHNRTADRINEKALAKLPGEVQRFEARVRGNFPQGMYPVPEVLELKPGAQLMFIRNDTDKAYYNGKLAKVSTIDEDGIQVEMLDDGSSYTLKQERWENKRYVLDPASKKQKEEVLGTFDQYPVKLAWAITVHKSQGLTFNKAIIDVGRAFAPGQVYVALSRLRTLDGLILRTRIDPAVVTTDRQVVAFNLSQHQQQPLPEQLQEYQQRYLNGIIEEAFNLNDLTTMAVALQGQHDPNEFEEETMKTALQRFADRLKLEEGNTRGFRNQLRRLLSSGEKHRFIERLGKGGTYYAELLRGAMKDLLRHLAQVEQLSRTKQYAEGLRELDGLLVKKLDQIVKAEPLARGMLLEEGLEGLTKLEEGAARRREELVGEVTSWLREHPPEATTKSGRKRKPKSPEGVFTPKEKPKQVKGETYRTTYAMLQEGKSLADVAQERGLALTTIEGHAARGIGEGEVDISTVLEENVRDTIAGWMGEHPDKSVAEARTHFGGAYSFGKLRMVQAWLKTRNMQ